MASVYDKSYLEKSEEVLKKGLELSPKRQEVYYELGWAKLLEGELKGEYEEAIEIYKTALALDEKVKESHWNLGFAYLLNKELEKGLAEIERSVEMGYGYGGDSNIILFIAESYAQVLNYNKAISLCDLVLEREPQNTKAMTRKTIHLAKAGNKNEAFKMIEVISKINQDLAEQLKKTIESL